MPQPSRALTCSPLLFRPVLRYLQAEGAQPELLARVGAMVQTADRLRVVDALAMVEQAAAELDEPDLGLRAALHSRIGDFPVLEWVGMSAPTWREATLAACRYARVLSDAADVRHEVAGDRTYLIVGTSVPIGRVVADFLVATFSLVIRMHEDQGKPEGREIWFMHPRPRDTTVYEQVFPGRHIVFGAPFNGFNGPVSRLDEPLETANSSLHDVLRDHSERLLAELAPDDSLVARVSADILSSMREGRASADLAAARLAMSRRTLARQLADHGTSYTDLLQQTRYRTAIHHLRYSSQTVEDIAFLLGFSECAPFVRAFKRWSGQSPSEYRRLHRAT
jgi:AraC-like DNA-binding protein